MKTARALVLRDRWQERDTVVASSQAQATTVLKSQSDKLEDLKSDSYTKLAEMNARYKSDALARARSAEEVSATLLEAEEALKGTLQRIAEETASLGALAARAVYPTPHADPDIVQCMPNTMSRESVSVSTNKRHQSTSPVLQDEGAFLDDEEPRMQSAFQQGIQPRPTQQSRGQLVKHSGRASKSVRFTSVSTGKRCLNGSVLAVVLPTPYDCYRPPAAGFGNSFGAGSHRPCYVTASRILANLNATPLPCSCRLCADTDRGDLWARSPRIWLRGPSSGQAACCRTWRRFRPCCQQRCKRQPSASDLREAYKQRFGGR